MEARTRTLQKTFHSDCCFQIPPYQRPYVWEREQQWEPLWTDIEATAYRLGSVRVSGKDKGYDAARADRDAPPHFLGAIVVEQQATPVGDVDVRSVVDGQQRLTTLQLLLRGVLDALQREGVQRSLIARVKKLIYNDQDITHGEAVNKIIPRPPERDDYFNALKPDAPDQHESTFASARAYFSEAACSFLQDDKVPVDPYSDGEEQHRRASLLVATVLSLVKLVVIDLDDVDDAQVIFEALNARGTPLSATDLVKNLLFMRAQSETGNAQGLYEKHWQRFESEIAWWRESVGTGHAQRPRQDWLMGDWLVAETGRVISVGRLYSEFRTWLDSSAKEVNAALTDLNDYADAYERMLGRRDGATKREQAAFSNVRALNITAATPVLLWLLVQPLDRLARSEREVAIRAIESFIVRRMAAKFQTRGYAQVFVDVLKAAKAVSENPGRAVVRALRGRPHGYGWPTLRELAEVFRTGRYYGAGGINRTRLTLLLGAIDNKLQEEAVKSESSLIEYQSLTVEHIIPQKWRQHWPILDEDINSRLLAEQLRDSRIHCIGNLTLVTDSLNPSLSNDPWEAKRKELGRHSHLQLNKLVCEKDAWDENAIEERGHWLAEQLGKVWPDPDSDAWDAIE